MIVQRERQALTAELAELERLQSTCGPGEELSKLGFEGRKEEIQARLAEVELRRGRVASAVLTFNGGPVLGTLGMNAEFGGQILQHFQGLVSRVAAARGRGEDLGTRGPVPDERSSQLLITGTARGSFGFGSMVPWRSVPFCSLA